MSEPPDTVIGMDTIVVDCGRCEVRGDACNDCVMMLLLGPMDAPALNSEEQHALDVMAEGGLLPPLRHVRTGREMAVG